ncbi:MAG TPA: hypothetical protein VGQ06_12335 [Gemmatimonadales bacterium]|nr:hypothetical protein [Gemmatimonadales bacterium]
MCKRWSVLVAATSLLLGCGEPTGGSIDLVIGTIDAGGTLDEVITGPTSGSVGERLPFTVSTFGNSCVAAAGADVVVQDLEATVTPYDHENRGATCLDYLKAYPRPVTVIFDRAGDATIRVQGRSFYQSGLVTVEHRVTVAP